MKSAHSKHLPATSILSKHNALDKEKVTEAFKTKASLKGPMIIFGGIQACAVKVGADSIGATDIKIYPATAAELAEQFKEKWGAPEKVVATIAAT